MTIAALLLIIALILAILAAANVSSRVGLFPAAFACFIASQLAPLVS